MKNTIQPKTPIIKMADGRYVDKINSIKAGAIVQVSEIGNIFPNTDVVQMLDGTYVSELETIIGAMDREVSTQCVTKNIINGRLTLGTEKYQKATMVNGTEIILPTVNSFTEIHLYFMANEALTIVFPNVKWQSQPTIEDGKYYEVIFTYVDTWLGGVVIYG